MKKSIASLALSLTLIVGLFLPISSITVFAEDFSSTAQKAEQPQDKVTSQDSAIQIPQEEFDTDSNNNGKGQSNDQTTGEDLSNVNISSLSSNSKEEGAPKTMLQF